MIDLREYMKEQDTLLRKMIKTGSSEPDATETPFLPADQKAIYDKIEQGFTKAIGLSDSQIRVAEQALTYVIQNQFIKGG
jgi:hypothetical protein